jgi:hypothetical protein
MAGVSRRPLGDCMPTLIRFFIVLVVLAGLGFAGMIALTFFVDPGDKDITIKIPPRELVPPSEPIDTSNLPPPVNVAPKESSSAGPASSAPASSDELPSIDTSDSEASDSGVKTVDTGQE